MYGKNLGDMAWMDLSVPDANHVKTFYQEILGWQSEAVSMSNEGEDYNDFSMNSVTPTIDSSAEESKGNSQFFTGICHAKGANADMPACWLPYFLVADINDAVVKVESLGGSLVTAIKSMGGKDKYVVIKDPAGAVCALYYKST
ncbi:MAG: VOC family protein [Colwellia sp.]|nr:VOC family protein [Colwellia sp.]